MGGGEQLRDMSRTKYPNHYLIGLTGNIATGKSTVMKILGELGAYTIDADKVAHQVMDSQQPVKEAIVRHFGENVLTRKGEMDRRALAEIVFKDPAALRQLEEIVHPAVIEAVDGLIEKAAERMIAVEAIKLIESGMHRQYDALWVVISPEEQQIERLVNQRGLSAEDARLRAQAQPPQSDKEKQADVVIDNSGSLENLRSQTVEAWMKAKKQFESKKKSIKEERADGSKSSR